MKTANATFFCLALGALACGGSDDNGSSGPGAGATLWTTSSDLELVRRVDSGSGEYEDIDVGQSSDQIAIGSGAIWVTTESSSVLRIDPTSRQVTDTIAVGGGGLRGIAAGDDAIWVTDDGNSSVPPAVHRIDPATKSIVASIELAVTEEPVDVAIGDDGVYVMIWNEFAVARIDPATNTIAQKTAIGQSGGYGYGELVVAAGAVYALDTYSDLMIELEPGTLVKKQELSVDNRFTGEMVWAGEQLFVADIDGDKVLAVDPATASVAAELDSGGTPSALASKGSTVVVGLSDGSGGDLLMFSAGGDKTGEVIAVYPDNIAVE